MFIVLNLLVFFALAGWSSSCILRSDSKAYKSKAVPEKPRLVVLIIVDQMRADFLDRFSNAFRQNSPTSEPEGLLRFYERGTAFMNARTASAPTVTAAGHATICTGATASKHGIIANMYFDRSRRELQEAAVDPATQLVRTPGLLSNDPLSRVDNPGSSETRLLTPNLADAMYDWSGGKSKTVSASIKNRGSVYCGGKNSAGVYWYDYQTGSMVTSSRYRQHLPEWVNRFNKDKRPNFNFIWKPSFPLATLKSFLGDARYKQALDVRSPLSQKYGHGFPYAHSSAEIGALGARKFFEYTPYASDYLVDFALEAQQQERLGCAQKSQGPECSAPQFADLLTVSFSTPDLVGHGFGPESLEHFDIYLNLNRSVERLRVELEARLGAGSILFVQTSDHGVQTLPEVTQALKGKSAGRLASQEIKSRFDAVLDARFGEEQWIDEAINAQVYFNRDALRQRNLSLSSVVTALKSEAQKIPGVSSLLSSEEISKGGNEEIELYKRGLQAERSGDAFLMVSDGWLLENSVAGNHGTANEDDTRIPMTYFGWRVPPQKVDSSVRADDVAPTVLSLIGANAPGFMTGKSLRGTILK